MPELVILNVPQDVLSRVRRLANKGDEEAQRWLKVDLWKDLYAALCLLLMRWRGASGERHPKLA